MTRVNYFGIINTAHAVIPRMVERGAGEFAAVASLTGIVSPKKMAAYGATKAAVISYLTSLNYETVKSGVVISVICPSAVATPMAVDFFADPEKRKKSVVTTPEKIVAAAEKGLRKKKLIVLPGLARPFSTFNKVSPGIMRAVQNSKRGDLI